MQDVWCWEMRRILELIYTGETLVPEMMTQRVLQTAQLLELTGMAAIDGLSQPLDLRSGQSQCAREETPQSLEGLPPPPLLYLGTGSKSLDHSHSSKIRYSSSRGGPPRSWTNEDLTRALEQVWNRRMTTSQASREFSIPYNSLLMYVRGIYGKSLGLEALKRNISPDSNLARKKRYKIRNQKNRCHLVRKEPSLCAVDQCGSEGDPFGLLGLVEEEDKYSSQDEI